MNPFFEIIIEVVCFFGMLLTTIALGFIAYFLTIYEPNQINFVNVGAFIVINTLLFYSFKKLRTKYGYIGKDSK